MICDKHEEFLKNSVYENFRKISSIPRNSFEEKKISDFLYKWAKERELEVYQDHSFNIFIRKPATQGYESAPTVLLQAHMDMVCEKSLDSKHDFSKDPIEFYIDGDIVSTRGKTTLGADNGIGVAYILSILESETISHPRLEALLTTAEEEDMSGAINFDTTQITASYLINLDHANDKEILCGSCGGMGVRLRLPISKNYKDKSLYRCFRISVEGLLGGHSGEDIHRGHGNANILLGRILNHIKSLNIDSKIDYIYEKINMIAKTVGAKVESFFPYPGWEVRSDSKLREVAINVYKNMFEEEPNVTAVHAGLECGCLLKGKPDLDAISIGPNAWGFHSPSERVSICSILKIWEYLKKVLLEIK